MQLIAAIDGSWGTNTAADRTINFLRLLGKFSNMDFRYVHNIWAAAQVAQTSLPLRQNSHRYPILCSSLNSRCKAMCEIQIVLIFILARVEVKVEGPKSCIRYNMSAIYNTLCIFIINSWFIRSVLVDNIVKTADQQCGMRRFGPEFVVEVVQKLCCFALIVTNEVIRRTTTKAKSLLIPV